MRDGQRIRESVLSGCVLMSRFFLVGWLLVISCSQAMAQSDPAPAVPPLPDGPLGDTIRLGQQLVNETNTHPMTQPFVGNDLRCTSCHLKGGTHPTAASFLDVATVYPAWSPREKRVITLEDRIGNCFMRSQHGRRPPLGSEVSVAITAYITWLSAGQPLKMNPQGPHGPRRIPPLSVDWSQASAATGKALYREHCAHCHAEEGTGTETGPPVWGPRSFNMGAGLARPQNLGAFLKVAMPPDDEFLSAEQARDLAAYLAGQSRPAFDLKNHLPRQEALGEYNSEVLEEKVPAIPQ